MTGRMVVVGDVLLDRDVHGAVARRCQDGRTPVLDVHVVHERPGGAGLTALLAAEAGADVVLVAPFADDRAGRTVRALLEQRVKVVALCSNGSTAVKTRLQTGADTMVRIDEGGPSALDGELPETARRAILDAPAVLVSDYGQRLTEHEGLRECLEAAAREAPLVWDPHRRGAPPVPGAAVVTPNEEDACRLARLSAAEVPGLLGVKAVADRLLRAWRAEAVAVTLGPRGALLTFGHGAPLLTPACRSIDGDACGAGDCLAATAATALADGAPTSEAVVAGVHAATEFVANGSVAGLFGAAPATDRDLDAARRLIDRVRGGGGTVVATGGCFDILHPGHVSMLRQARALGDCLVVLLNDDESVRRLKGPSRPLNPQWHRREVLRSLGVVDEVVTFSGVTPAETLAELRPDVWVKGGDYADRELPEAEVVRGFGGEIVLVPYLDGYSTTGLIRAAGERSGR